MSARAGRSILAEDAPLEGPESTRSTIHQPPPTDASRRALSAPSSASSISTLSPPSLIENTLAHFGIKTIEDLLQLDLQQVATSRGVGKAKLEALSKLVERAQSCVSASAGSPQAASGRDAAGAAGRDQPTLLDELSALELDLDEPWAHVLIRLNQRARTVLEREGLVTLRELVLRYESGALRTLQGLGEGTLRHIAEQLEALVVLGAEGVGLGLGGPGPPCSTQELVDRLLAQLSASELDLLTGRLVEGLSYEQLAQRLELSREGARQRLERLLEQWRARAGHALEGRLEPALERMSAQGGALHIHDALGLTGARDRARLMVAMAIVGEPISVWHERFLRTQGGAEEHALGALMAYVSGQRRDLLPMQELTQVAASAGLRLPQEQLAQLLSVAWSTPARQGMLVHPWLDLGAQATALLREHGRPARHDELLAMMQQRYHLEAAPTKAALIPQLQRSPEVYTLDRGLVVHQDHLPISREALERAAAWTKEQLRGTPHAVSASIFLPQLQASGLLSEPISSTLLRDVMGRDPDIRTFQSTDFVAHRDSFQGQRKTQEEHVLEILSEAQEPLTCDEVCQRYPSYLTYHRNAIYTTLSQSEHVLNMPQGRFMHRAAIGLTRQVLQRLIEATRALILSQDGPMSASTALELLRPLPAALYLQAHPQGSTILWALCRRQEGLICGRGELIMARQERPEDADPLSYALLAILEQEVLMTPGQLRREVVFRHGYLCSYGPIYTALERACAAGLVRKILGRWRAAASATTQTLIAALLDPERGVDLEAQLERADQEHDLHLLHEAARWSGQDHLLERVAQRAEALKVRGS